jgi:DNA-binding transcriptional MerR regulator
MKLKVGELAKRTGLTVRTLHHYDSIGLLTPSARSDSGYRLYQRDDIARLHQIQALRRFGMSLAAIGTFLATPEAPFNQIIAQQIAALDRQIDQATLLRKQLSALQRQLDDGNQPELADWLTTLELMTMYDKYFSKEELERLPLYQQGSKHNKEWADLVAQVRALMDAGTPPDSVQAQRLSSHWMTMLERDTKADPDFARRLDAMMRDEPGAQQQSGVTPDLKEYVVQAFSAVKLALYAKYLDEDEIRHMRANSGRNVSEWLALIAAVQQQMDSGAAPTDPAVQALAREWMALFQRYIGNNPATLAKVRIAHEKEPALLTGTWMSDAMLAFIRQSTASLQAA